MRGNGDEFLEELWEETSGTIAERAAFLFATLPIAMWNAVNISSEVGVDMKKTVEMVLEMKKAMDKVMKREKDAGRATIMALCALANLCAFIALGAAHGSMGFKEIMVGLPEDEKWHRMVWEKIEEAYKPEALERLGKIGKGEEDEEV